MTTIKRSIVGPIPFTSRTRLALAGLIASGLAITPILAPPPLEVSNVRVQGSPGAYVATWNALSGIGSYHVYRGTVAGLHSGNQGACFVGSVQGTSASVAGDPPVGSAYFYVVSGYTETSELSLGSLNPSPRCIPARRFFTLTRNGDPGDGVIDGSEPRLNPDADSWSAGYVATGVYLHTGEFFAKATDLRIPERGLDFVFRRSYRSQIAYNGPLGPGWDFAFNARLVPSGSNVLYFDGTGRQETFTRIDATRFTSPPGLFSRLTQIAGGSFSLRSPAGTIESFHALDGSNRQGSIESITDRNGNQMVMNYDAQGLLITITDPVGRLITLTYDILGRLATLTDLTGRTVVYGHDANGDLVSVRSPVVTGTPNGNDFPSGKTTQFVYSSGQADARANHNLLQIIAPREFGGGPPVLQNTYGSTPGAFDFDRVTAQTIGGTNVTGVAAGGSQTFGYASLFPGRAATLFDRNGNRRDYVHDSSGHLLSATEFTNREIRPGEGDYVTGFSYSPEGLIASMVLPRGNSFAYVYDAGNPRRESQGNLLEVRSMANGLAVILDSSADLVTRYTYEPVFNQERTITDPRAFPFGAVPLDVNGHLDLNDALVTRYTTTSFYDYQEETGFQSASGISSAESIPEGLGDLNGAADFNEGNLVRTHLPTIQTPGPNLGQAAFETMRYNDAGQMIGKTDAAGHVTTQSYDPVTGYLTSSTRDPGGLNLVTQFVNDAVGNAVRTIDPKSQPTDSTFNALNQTVRKQTPIVVGSTRYQEDSFFDANDNLTRIETLNFKEDGTPYPHAVLVETKEFDILDDLRADNRDRSLNDNSVVGTVRTEFVRDPNQNLQAVRKPLAVLGVDPFNVVTLMHDERDLLYRVVTGTYDTDPMNPPPGTATILTANYDANRNLIESIDSIRHATHSNAPVTVFPGSAVGDVTRRDYDGFDRWTRAADAEGNESYKVYDAASNLIATTLVGTIDHTPGAPMVILKNVAWTIDERNRVVQRDIAHNQPRTGTPIGDGHSLNVLTFDQDGKVVAFTDDRSLTSTVDWDAAERPTRTVDALGNVVLVTYDPDGNPSTFTRQDVSTDLASPPNTYLSVLVHDPVNRLAKLTDPAGDVTEYFHDSRGNLVRTSDALRGAGQPTGPGNIVRQDFDGLNRLVRTEKVLTSNGRGDSAQIGLITTLQSWDDDSRLVGQVDANGRPTGYGFDGHDRLTTTTNADFTATNLQYDTDDHVVTWTDPNGSVSAMTFDGLDHVLTRSISRGPGVLGVTFESFGYDGAGRPTFADGDDGFNPGSLPTLIDYDSMSNPIRETEGPYSVDSSFDGASNRVATTYPGGFGAGRAQVSRTFDELNRLRQVSEDAGVIATLHYKGGRSRLERRTYGPDASPIASLDVLYDPLPRPIDLNYSSPIDGTIERFQYGYDRMGNQLFEKRIHEAGRGDVYLNDSIERVIGDFQLVSLLSVLPGTEIDPLAYATAPNRQEYVLEGAGNRTLAQRYVGGTATPTTYVSNAMNEYTQTRIGVGAPVGYTFDSNGNLLYDGSRQYSFDADNRLVEVRDGSTSALIARYSFDPFGRRRLKLAFGTTMTSLYDGPALIEERDASSTVTRQYFWGDGIDHLLKEESTADGDLFSLENATGTVVGVIDDTGTLVEGYRFDPFGVLKALQGGTTGNRIRFHSAYLDPETGLYLMRARNYSPALGRFVQRDPLGTWHDGPHLGNPYTLGRNNPVNFTDPWGLESVKAGEDDLSKWLEEIRQKLMGMHGSETDTDKQRALSRLQDLLMDIESSRLSTAFMKSIVDGILKAYSPEEFAGKAFKLGLKALLKQMFEQGGLEELLNGSLDLLLEEALKDIPEVNPTAGDLPGEQLGGAAKDKWKELLSKYGGDAIKAVLDLLEGKGVKFLSLPPPPGWMFWASSPGAKDFFGWYWVDKNGVWHFTFRYEVKGVAYIQTGTVTPGKGGSRTDTIVEPPTHIIY
jgi:RHS repeat-associated protein